MEIKEAINIFWKDLDCLRQFETNCDKCASVPVCENHCPYYVPKELLIKAEQTVIEYFEGEKK